jgi:RimJ/RimL family protein N-acetyltransferase
LPESLHTATDGQTFKSTGSFKSEEPSEAIRGMTMTIPPVESARLLLRGHRQEDYAGCAALWGDPEVTRYIGGRPLTKEEVWARLLRYAGHWLRMGYGFWVVEEKATGKFVGEVGYANLQREIELR